MAAADQTLVVAAIDFGTTYSGWAFSFRHEYQTTPTKVSAKQQWPGGRLVSEKAPTCVLIKPDGKTLEAFGFEAENKYTELAEENCQEPYYYFQRFKMMLFDKMTMKRHDTLKDISGKTLPAKTVFALAIRFLKDDLQETLRGRYSGNPLQPGDIKWVLTVPAIWTDSAKQFMREAATEAGIAGNNLLIALEPEAASVFCKHLPLEEVSSGDKQELTVFRPGQKYMILDAGGGTVDITTHEVTEAGVLREIHKASGGAWGGTKVDEVFFSFFAKIFTDEVISTFKATCVEEYLELMRDFEVKKRDAAPSKDNKMTIRVPPNLLEIFHSKEPEYSIADRIAEAGHANSVVFISGGSKLRIDSSVMKSFFTEAVDSVADHVRTLLEEPQVATISSIVMVGGFSDSPMLRSRVKAAFNKTVIMPKDASLVVLKGAVISGHCPSMIAERIVKYTYGIEVQHEFNEREHPKSKKLIIDGEEYCDDIFDAFVKVGQTVIVGKENIKRSYCPVSADQTKMDISIYASTSEDPMFVTDSSCFRIGQFTLNMPDITGGEDREVCTKMTFSGPEIEVEAIDKTTGNVKRLNVDFLG